MHSISFWFGNFSWRTGQTGLAGQEHRQADFARKILSQIILDEASEQLVVISAGGWNNGLYNKAETFNIKEKTWNNATSTIPLRHVHNCRLSLKLFSGIGICQFFSQSWSTCIYQCWVRAKSWLGSARHILQKRLGSAQLALSFKKPSYLEKQKMS